MANQYSLFVVVDGKEYGVELVSPYSEEEAQNAMRTFQSFTDGWIGLVDGSMIALNRVNCNFYFICKRTGE
jgi:hypothetical protein